MSRSLPTGEGELQHNPFFYSPYNAQDESVQTIVEVEAEKQFYEVFGE